MICRSQSYYKKTRSQNAISKSEKSEIEIKRYFNN